MSNDSVVVRADAGVECECSIVGTWLQWDEKGRHE